MKIRKRIRIFGNARLELIKLRVSLNILKSWQRIVTLHVVLIKDRQKWIQSIIAMNNK